MPVNIKGSPPGFTLIELIAGIVAFSAVMVVVITIVVNQSRQSIDPIWQTRASELAQSLVAEISSRAFDEASAMSGGIERCGDDTTADCTAPEDLGPEADEIASGVPVRSLFDDVDDYNGLSESSGDIADALGNQIALDGDPLYSGFRSDITVIYDSDFDAADDGSTGNVKRVEIAITTPGNEVIRFSFYKWDY